MSNDPAKELLAQADRLMKKGRTSLDDLPVLTDFVPADGPEPVTPVRAPTVARSPLDSPTVGAVRTPSADAGPATIPAGAIVLTRAQFDQRIADKLEELQHAVFSQAMQQLELHAAGSLKERLRDALLPALNQVAADIAHQVAEETADQVRAVVSQAVADEVRRLRERLAQRRT